MGFSPEMRNSLPAAAFVCIALVLFGCKPEKPPPSRQALAFKKAAQDTINKLAPRLMESVAGNDERSVDRIIEETFSRAGEAPVPYSGIVVLDERGITVGGKYPNRPHTPLDYSKYTHVMKAIEDRETVQARLFLQDGTRIFAICSPLTGGDRVEGVIVLALTAREAKQQWGISEEEFLALDFNR